MCSMVVGEQISFRKPHIWEMICGNKFYWDAPCSAMARKASLNDWGPVFIVSIIAFFFIDSTQLNKNMGNMGKSIERAQRGAKG